MRRGLLRVLVFSMRRTSDVRPIGATEQADEPIGNVGIGRDTGRLRRLQQATPTLRRATAIVVPASAPLPAVPSAPALRIRRCRRRQRSSRAAAGVDRRARKHRPAARIRASAAGFGRFGAAGVSAAAIAGGLRREPAVNAPSRFARCADLHRCRSVPRRADCSARPWPPSCSMPRSGHADEASAEAKPNVVLASALAASPSDEAAAAALTPKTDDDRARGVDDVAPRRAGRRAPSCPAVSTAGRPRAAVLDVGMNFAAPRAGRPPLRLPLGATPDRWCRPCRRSASACGATAGSAPSASSLARPLDRHRRAQLRTSARSGSSGSRRNRR